MTPTNTWEEQDPTDESIADEEGSGLYEHHHIKVDKGQVVMRLDKFVMIRISNTTRTKVQNACDAGSVLVNGKPTKSSYKIKPFDEISIVLTVPPRDVEVVPENIPIDIVFEDPYIALINKKPGMVVHPGYGNYRGTLVNALAWHFKNLPTTKQKLDDVQMERPGLVHRIDKNTSGIIIIAKTEIAMTRLAKDFFDRTMDRKYLAIAWGNLKEDSGTIIGNVGRDLKDRKRMAVFPEGSEHGKHAITHYKVVERLGYITLVECKLETGRTHQIRVHFKHIGHPLFNDHEYGGDRILKGEHSAKYKQFVENCFDILPRQALHAKTLGITHPISGEKLFFDSALPPDMQTLLDKWRRYMKDRHTEEV